LSVKVEVLYVPTCAGFLMWLERIRKVVADFGSDIIIDEVNLLLISAISKNTDIQEKQRKD